ncbi:MAG: nitrate ABC transporter ATP-binding protein [Cyanobacteria bacterium]|nr:nitrate ABC transporter ATP-binding protein [Cyanobacteriota bacterium]
MSAFLEVDHVDRVFDLPDGGTYIALENISLKIEQGEFVTLLGHSGCGKSTLLNIVAGLDQPSSGGVVLEGRQVNEPGPDRMVIFQNYSLLPWKTVRENIALAVDTVCKELPPGERTAIVDRHIEMVGLMAAADKYPGQLSGGMKQRVAIARGLAIRPRVLLLDEPFGALDALTRGGLQEQLMRICEESQVTCIMVTHDVDEALLLSDRVVMLTTGPSARVGQVLKVDIPRPRHRMEVVNHPSYYALRNEMVYFLNQQKRSKKRKGQVAVPQESSGAIAAHGLEKVNLNLGFIPLTDCAPLIMAQEKGFFAKHGLDRVTLHRQPSWKAISVGVADGSLDGAAMVAGMPLAMTLGSSDFAPTATIAPMVLSRNGNAITWSRKLYDAGITDLTAFKGHIQADPDKVHTFGMVHPSSMHNLILRYWLASGGIDPDWDLSLAIVPPPQMVANLKAGNIDGYCVGEPWNSRAVQDGIGVVMATDLDLFPDHVEKVLGVSEAWAQQHPKTLVALIAALLEACEYCDDRRNREEILAVLSQPDYVGLAPEVMAPGFYGSYDRGLGGEPEALYQFNRFFVDKSASPDWVQSLWMMAEMARWDIIPFPKNWVEVTERINPSGPYLEAARLLGLPTAARDRKPFTLFDGTVFDPDVPLDYLNSHMIKRNARVEEVRIDEIFSCSISLPKGA